MSVVLDRDYTSGLRRQVLDFIHTRLSQEEVFRSKVYEELYNDVNEFLESHQSLDDEWKYWTEVQEFFNKYKLLTDRRSKADKIREIIEMRCQFGGSENWEAEMSAYYPEEYHKEIPKKGCWIMIIRVPYVEEQYRPHQYGVYYAIPEWTKSRLESYEIRRLKAKINTEAGEVMVLPHEYIIVRDIKDVVEGVGKEYDIVKLGGSAAYDAEKVYYLLTRGVPMEEAYQLLLGDIGSINFQYFKLKPEAFEAYDFLIGAMQKGITYEMAQRLWYHKCTGTPLFTLKKKDNGKSRAEGSEDRPKDDPAPDEPVPEAGEHDSPPGPKRKR